MFIHTSVHTVIYIIYMIYVCIYIYTHKTTLTSCAHTHVYIYIIHIHFVCIYANQVYTSWQHLFDSRLPQVLCTSCATHIFILALAHLTGATCVHTSRAGQSQHIILDNPHSKTDTLKVINTYLHISSHINKTNTYWHTLTKYEHISTPMKTIHKF
jgi:hypothetical protein